MSIPTSLGVPEERGVYNFTQSVARAIVCPSHCSVPKFSDKEFEKKIEEDSFPILCSYP